MRDPADFETKLINLKFKETIPIELHETKKVEDDKNTLEDKYDTGINQLMLSTNSAFKGATPEELRLMKSYCWAINLKAHHRWQKISRRQTTFLDAAMRQQQVYDIQ